MRSLSLKSWISVGFGLCLLCLMVTCGGPQSSENGECRDDFGCPMGSICVQNGCVKLCKSDDDCDTGQCIEGLCGKSQNQGVEQDKGKEAPSPDAGP